MKIENYALIDRKIRRIGAEVTICRENIRRSADALLDSKKEDIDGRLNEVSKLGQKVRMRSYKQGVASKKPSKIKYMDPVPVGRRRRLRKRRNLSISEKIDITHKVIC